MTDEELKKMDEETGNNDKFVFMREEIKSRPVNKKKFARNTILAASSAVIFGIVACVTFALVAPFIMDKLSERDNQSDSEAETPVVITFPEESADEEMNPEDMLVAGDETEEDKTEESTIEEEEIKEMLSDITFTVSDYQDLYKSLSDIASEAEKSLVRVTPVKKGTDWLNYMYEGESELTGVILADTDTELYIVTKYSSVRAHESVVVTFVNNVQAEAKLVNYDSQSDLCVLSVDKESLNEVTKEAIVVATLGTSYSSNLVGTPIIAIGSPMGTYGSVNYGIVTSNSDKIVVVDNYYKQVVTNIYGSQSASGVIINLKGEIVGIIDSKHPSSDTKNLICSLGISELKKTLERLTNGKDVVLLGITGSDVPSDAVILGAPSGVFVLSVELDSPAMEAGIQSGDIISKIGDVNISQFSEFLKVLRTIDQGSEVPIVINRSVQDEYKEIVINVNFDKINQ